MIENQFLASKSSFFVLFVMMLPGLAYGESPDIQHVNVFANPRLFAGWPANEGMWSWGDEILVAFNVSKYKERDGHNLDSASDIWVCFSRSVDGGLTWTVEEHPEVSPTCRFRSDGSYKHDVSKVARLQTLRESFDCRQGDLAIKVRLDRFFVSVNRGRLWKGPFRLPDFGMTQLRARTNFLISDSGTCRLFFCGTDREKDKRSHGRVMMVESVDGGATFEKVAWLTPDPGSFDGGQNATIAYSIMPSVVQLESGEIVAALRNRVEKRCWTEVVVSQDQGRSWSTRSTPVERNNNPAALVSLGGQRIAIVYGVRGRPNRLCGKLSDDAGNTWSEEYVLRDDAREWDHGYVRACRRSDGCIVIVYYYTTDEQPANHIAATIWDPPTMNDE